MTLFQILILLLILLLLILTNRRMDVLFERIFIILITLGGAYFVLVPESASKIANMVGIGRGADLVFYLFIIFSLFWFTSTSVKMRATDQKLTQIVRSIAITNPVVENKDSDIISYK